MNSKKILEVLAGILSRHFSGEEYCIGAYQECAFCLEQTQDGWSVYGAERGNRFQEERCSELFPACLLLMRQLTDDRDLLVSMENELLSAIKNVA